MRPFWIALLMQAKTRADVGESARFAETEQPRNTSGVAKRDDQGRTDGLIDSKA